MTIPSVNDLINLINSVREFFPRRSQESHCRLRLENALLQVEIQKRNAEISQLLGQKSKDDVDVLNRTLETISTYLPNISADRKFNMAFEIIQKMKKDKSIWLMF